MSGEEKSCFTGNVSGKESLCSVHMCACSLGTMDQAQEQQRKGLLTRTHNPVLSQVPSPNASHSQQVAAYWAVVGAGSEGSGESDASSVLRLSPSKAASDRT